MCRGMTGEPRLYYCARLGIFNLEDGIFKYLPVRCFSLSYMLPLKMYNITRGILCCLTVPPNAHTIWQSQSFGNLFCPRHSNDETSYCFNFRTRFRATNGIANNCELQAANGGAFFPFFFDSRHIIREIVN